VAAPSTRVDVDGFDRVQLVEVSSGKGYPPGEVPPGRYQVVALFDGLTRTTTVTVDVAEGQAVSVRCSASLGNCRVR
jgi:hypothetical protein